MFPWFRLHWDTPISFFIFFKICNAANIQKIAGITSKKLPFIPYHPGGKQSAIPTIGHAGLYHTELRFQSCESGKHIGDLHPNLLFPWQQHGRAEHLKKLKEKFGDDCLTSHCTIYQIIKVAGCSPIREWVLLIKSDTTLDIPTHRRGALAEWQTWCRRQGEFLNRWQMV